MPVPACERTLPETAIQDIYALKEKGPTPTDIKGLVDSLPYKCLCPETLWYVTHVLLKSPEMLDWALVVAFEKVYIKHTKKWLEPAFKGATYVEHP